MNLRPYQDKALDDTRAALARRPILVLPTGAGKTYTAAQLVRDFKRSTLWIAHRRELVAQAVTSLERLGLTVGTVMAGTSSTPDAQVQVASVQTLVRRPFPGAQLVIIDECHHATATTYRKVLDHYPDAPVVGLTATPFRASGESLGDIFGEIVVGAWPDELCADGTLVEPVVYAPADPDLSGVHIRRGDFATGELARAMSKPRLVGDIVKTWERRSPGRRTVVFAVNVKHSKQIVAAFRDAGIVAEHIDGGTSAPQRDASLYRLRTGYTRVVSNCQVLTEGWDLPALETAIVARPTASLCLHLQMLGRIMRGAPDKSGAMVLDHAGNHLRHGFVTQRVEYSLDHQIASAGGKPTGVPATKRCPSCYLVVRSTTPECPCGHVFAESTRTITHVEGELVALTATAPPRPSIEQQQEWWNVLEFQRNSYQFKEAWTFYRFKDRFGFRPLVHEGVVCDPATCGMVVKKAVYARLAGVAASKGYKRGWAAHQYRSIFGVWPQFKRSA